MFSEFRNRPRRWRYRCTLHTVSRGPESPWILPLTLLEEASSRWSSGRMWVMMSMARSAWNLRDKHSSWPKHVMQVTVGKKLHSVQDKHFQESQVVLKLNSWLERSEHYPILNQAICAQERLSLNQWKTQLFTILPASVTVSKTSFSMYRMAHAQGMQLHNTPAQWVTEQTVIVLCFIYKGTHV